VTCWQLGSNTPLTLDGPAQSRYVALSVTDHDVCAVKENNALDCWFVKKANAPTDRDPSYPPQDLPLEEANLGSRSRNGCGIAVNGILNCW